RRPCRERLGAPLARRPAGPPLRLGRGEPMKSPRPWRAAALALLAAAAPLGAQEKPADSPADPPAQEPADRTAEGPAERPPAGSVASAGADGVLIQSDRGDYRLRIDDNTQADVCFIPMDESKLGPDTFLLRRVRPQLVGTVAQRFDFYLVPDFGGGQAVIQDAYLDARFSPAFRFLVGK